MCTKVLLLFFVLIVVVVSDRRIVTIGDIHGDYDQAVALLRMCDVIDEEGKWIAEPGTTVVQMGDLIDRGPSDSSVVELFQRLKKDGNVVVLLGNHELMNLMGHFHYVHPESMEESQGRMERMHALQKGKPLGDFFRSLPVAHVDGKSLFVHAGLLSSTLEMEGDGTIDGLNAKARQLLESDEFSAGIFANDGPLWTRRIVYEARAGRCAELDRTLSQLYLDRMIVGHTPERSGSLGELCEGRLIVVDVGISKWMYGNLAALEITVLDNGEVELREVLPSLNVNAEEPPESFEDALKRDPALLQEMNELAQDAVRMNSEHGSKLHDDEL